MLRADSNVDSSHQARLPDQIAVFGWVDRLVKTVNASSRHRSGQPDGFYTSLALSDSQLSTSLHGLCVVPVFELCIGAPHKEKDAGGVSFIALHSASSRFFLHGCGFTQLARDEAKRCAGGGQVMIGARQQEKRNGLDCSRGLWNCGFSLITRLWRSRGRRQTELGGIGRRTCLRLRGMKKRTRREGGGMSWCLLKEKGCGRLQNGG